MKKKVSRLIAFMSVPTDNSELLKAQYNAFARQMPMMYFILLTSTWAVAITHFQVAPIWLTVVIPSLFTAGGVIRVAHWWKSRRIVPDAQTALIALRRTNNLAFLIAAGFSGWAFMLFPYGDAYMRSHLAFYMAITVITCIFCLMYLRSAAVMVTAIVNGSFIVFFAATGQPTFIAITVNIAMVSAGMLVVLAINYRNFAQMVNAQVKTKALSDENWRLANLDSLTGLPNRRAFFSHLETKLHEARQNNARLAVGVIDLDGFKPVNDIYGHSIGDKLLIQVGDQLTALPLQSHTRFFRLGGDEFAYVTDHVANNGEILPIGEMICETLQRPFLLPGAQVQISGSAGLAVFPDSATSPEELFDRADYALYQGKRSRRGTVTVFNNTLDEQIHRDALIEQTLKQADLQDELSIVFQPIIDVTQERTIGFEALARWHSPVLGIVPPDSFITVAERAGFIGKLTSVLFEKALAAASGWPKGTRLSFNLSAQDLSAHENILSLVSLICKSGHDPRCIDFEITETAIAHDFEQVSQSIGKLCDLGCGISLDDFGTGYSSLTRLHALPLTKIKIDRSFVTNIDTNSSSLKIVRSLLTLSRDMSLDCVIEGVETSAELETIRKLGGNLVQGYFYAPPMKQEDTRAYLEKKIEKAITAA